MPDRDKRFTQEDHAEKSPQEPAALQDSSEEPLEETQPKQPTHRSDGYVIESPSIVMPLQQKLSKQKTLQHGRLHLFSEFCEYPQDVTFHDQEDDEDILLFLRKSQVANLPWIVTTLILFVLPLGIFAVPPAAFPFRIPMGLTIILVLFYYLGSITYAFVNFVIWYYNAALITTKRVVDIDFHQLIYKDIAETKLGLVQDVSYRQQSVIESLFDFGHVLIQTAGTIDNFEFSDLPKPERIEEIVNNLIGRGRVYVP